MIFSKTDPSLETVSKMKCKNSSLVGVFGQKLARSLMSKFLPLVSSKTCKQNSEKALDKMPKKLEERLKTPSNKNNLQEEQNQKRSNKRQPPEKKFLQMNRRLLFQNKKLKCTNSNLILRKRETRLSTTKDQLSRNKREKCMLRNSRFKTQRKRLKMHKEFFKLKCQTTFKRSKLICKMRHKSTSSTLMSYMKKNYKN